jgi:nuclear transport factor 2 (NTF2) superfamily protein
MKTESKPPLPPFDSETAVQKVRLAEDAWNSRDPDRVSLAYTMIWNVSCTFYKGRI